MKLGQGIDLHKSLFTETLHLRNSKLMNHSWNFFVLFLEDSLVVSAVIPALGVGGGEIIFSFVVSSRLAQVSNKQ